MIQVGDTISFSRTISSKRHTIKVDQPVKVFRVFNGEGCQIVDVKLPSGALIVVRLSCS